MLFVHVSGGLVVWSGVGCSCPPVHNDIVTLRHLFLFFPLKIFFPIPKPFDQIPQGGKENVELQTGLPQLYL